HQPGTAGTGDGEPGGGYSDPSTAPGRPGGSPHGVSYGKKGGAKEVPLFAGIGLFNTALGRWLSSFKVKANTKAALEGASILAAVFTGMTSFVADLAKKAVRGSAKVLGGVFRRFRRPGGARGGALIKRQGSVSVLGKAHPSELSFADELAGRGYDVVVRGKHTAGADFLVDGIQWELKTLNAGTISAVRQNLRKGLKQGDGRVFIDGRAAGLSHGNAIRAVQQHARAGRMGRAVEVRVLSRSGEYVWTP
ncbi:MAG: hypothetical protein MJE77_21395, partial [Proteobacteria bacterium]|nr:hypothetical protein [Pseudomonadota bacterium]